MKLARNGIPGNKEDEEMGSIYYKESSHALTEQ